MSVLHLQMEWPLINAMNSHVCHLQFTVLFILRQSLMVFSFLLMSHGLLKTEHLIQMMNQLGQCEYYIDASLQFLIELCCVCSIVKMDTKDCKRRQFPYN